MSVYTASLNSGSNGNCYYIGNEQDAVLIDAGLSCRETEKRMKRLGLSMQRVRAIFISHEHSDHIKGATVLSHKYQLPVYVSPRTLQYGRLHVVPRLVGSLLPHEPVPVGSLRVTPFPKHHDAVEPSSFIVTAGACNVGVFTDIGRVCEHLTEYFGRCHAAFLEANYDEDMLAKGNYPYHLKKRISGGLGHLSNREALELFTRCRPEAMSHLFLSHLSRENNCPELVKSLFDAHAEDTEVVVASRYEESKLYVIGAASPSDALLQGRAKAEQGLLF